MAISKNNALTAGLSGMLGGTVVFRQWRGKTIMANRPAKSTYVSAKQRECRDLFLEAIYFAKSAMKVAERKAYYAWKAEENGLLHGYNAALTDFLRTKGDLKVLDLEFERDWEKCREDGKSVSREDRESGKDEIKGTRYEEKKLGAEIKAGSWGMEMNIWRKRYGYGKKEDSEDMRPGSWGMEIWRKRQEYERPEVRKSERFVKNGKAVIENSEVEEEKSVEVFTCGGVEVGCEDRGFCYNTT